MNDILKKRFRKIIRKHFEEKFTPSFQRTKEMYTTISLVDAILDEVTVDDLIPVERMKQIKILADVTGYMYEYPLEKLLETISIYHIVTKKGDSVEMVVTFRKVS